MIPRTLSLLMALLAACAPQEPPTLLKQIQASGEIVVVTRNSATTYYEAAEGAAGLEHDLVQAFAKELGVNARFVIAENESEVIDSLVTGYANMAAAGLARSKELEQLVQFAPSYQTVKQQLIYRIGTHPPASMDQLKGKHIEVPEHSRYARSLEGLKSRYSGLTWTESPDKDTEELINLVSDGLLEYTVTDSHIYRLNRRHYPDLRAAMDISTAERLAWAFQLHTDGSLVEAATSFIDKYNKSGDLGRLLERYYGAALRSNPVNMTVFHLRIQNRLPNYQDLFEKAGARHNLDWRLLASISYQESFWSPQSVSHTGVRGIMMLTRDTAREVGVANRLDPEQAIEGGARYVRKLIDRIPADIPEPDRIWLALAAYNVGFGHMEDARILTERLGGNPDKWSDVQQRLPLLSHQKYHKTTNHGYARGVEPVQFVNRIRNYYEALVKIDEEQQSDSQNKAIQLRAPAI